MNVRDADLTTYWRNARLMLMSASEDNKHKGVVLYTL